MTLSSHALTATSFGTLSLPPWNGISISLVLLIAAFSNGSMRSVVMRRRND
jgi:hypothetical protein